MSTTSNVTTAAKLTDAQVLAGRVDVEMFKRPHLWPAGSVLPLKRYGAERKLQLGTLVTPSLDNGRWTTPSWRVYLCNMWEVGPNATMIEYLTAEAMAEAGWIVD